MNINEIIKQEIEKTDFESLFRETLNSQIKSTIEKTLKDSLGSYSQFSKALDKVVKSSLNIDPSEITLPQYNEFVTKQALDVIQQFMDEERASKLRQVFTAKIAPHLEKEIEFDALIEEIKSALYETYEEHDCNPEIYRIECVKDERSYFSKDYFVLKILKGENKLYDDKMAALYVGDGYAYHHDGDKRNEFCKRFASYAFNRTKINGIDEFNETIKAEDLI